MTRVLYYRTWMFDEQQSREFEPFAGRLKRERGPDGAGGVVCVGVAGHEVRVTVAKKLPGDRLCYRPESPGQRHCSELRKTAVSNPAPKDPGGFLENWISFRMCDHANHALCGELTENFAHGVGVEHFRQLHHKVVTSVHRNRVAS